VKRGELYLVKNPRADPRRQRAFVVVSRQGLLDSRHTTLICAPIYTRHDGLRTQVAVGINEGFKHPSSIHCDDLTSLLKSDLTNYIGRLSPQKITELDRALAIALDLPEEDEL
jgi:mRNA interferase MazF